MASAADDARTPLVEAIGATGRACGVPLLIRELTAGTPESARAAATGLARQGHPAGPAAAALEASRTTTKTARAIIAELAGTARRAPSTSPRITRHLAWLLRRAPSPEIRTAAAAALGGSSAPEAGRALREALTEDRDPLVRHRALESLAGQTTPETLAALDRALLTDPYAPIQSGAAAALGTSRRGSLALEPLRRYLDTDKRSALEPALRGLGRLGDASDLPLLKRHLEDEDGYVRAAALLAIGDLGLKDEGAEAVLGRLEDRWATTRRAAALAAAALGLERARKTLRRLARRDPDAQVREAAQEALERLTPKKP